MKKSTILFLTICLAITLLTGGCENNSQYEDIPIELPHYPYGQEGDFIKQVSCNDILLFDASKITFDEMKRISADGEKSTFISYDKSDSIPLFSIRNTMTGVGYICNFPDVVKNWNINPTGTYISIVADEFLLLNNGYGISANTYSILILKSFKRKIL